jgi:hypothetical protein
MGDNPSIAVQREHPVSTTERPHEVESTVDEEARRTLQGYLAILISVSIFGGSTFFSLVSQLAEPTKFSITTVRTFMAVSWLLFVLTFACAFTSSMLIGPHITVSKVIGSGQDSKLNTRVGIFFLSLTHFSAIGAFLFMALVVMAYAEAVGWVAVGLTVVAAVGGFFIWSFVLM